jgi:hypothetical protein
VLTLGAAKRNIHTKSVANKEPPVTMAATQKREGSKRSIIKHCLAKSSLGTGFAAKTTQIETTGAQGASRRERG